MTGSTLPLELTCDRVLGTIAATAQWVALGVVVAIAVVLLLRSLAERHNDESGSKARPTPG